MWAKKARSRPVARFHASRLMNMAAPEAQKNGHRVVVLTLVGFNVAKNPTPTKRIPVFVDESAGCAGVFEFVALIIVDEVRLRRPQIRVLRNQFHQLR